MPFYGISSNQIKVEHQAAHWLCWAAVTKALVQYHGATVFDQQSLAKKAASENLIKSENSPGNPVTILTKLSSYKGQFDCHTVWKQITKVSSASERDQVKSDLKWTLQCQLDQGPLLAQFAEKDDAVWNVINSQGKQTTYTFSHAALVINYKDDKETITLADPASYKGPQKITIDELVNGFLYTRQQALGQQTLAAFQGNPPAKINARLKGLTCISRKKSKQKKSP